MKTPEVPKRAVHQGWSLLLARPFGIEVYVHATLAILLVWIFVSQLASGSLVAEAAGGVLVTVLVFGLIVLHELGHALVARRFGIKTTRITLWPIGGVSVLERLPERPSEELRVALAGPAVNLALAAVCGLVGVALGSSMGIDQLLVVSLAALPAKLMWINVGLALFNLLPAFPMDGGRVLRAVLGFWLNRQRATEVASAAGKGMAVLFAFAGLFFAPTLLLIAAFVWFGASAEAGQVRLARRLEGVQAQDVMATHFEALAVGAPLEAASSRLARGFQRYFPIVDNGQMVGLLTQDDVRRGLASLGPTSSIEQSMHGQFPSAKGTEPMATVLGRLTDPECGVVTVIEEGKPVGLITLQQVADLLSGEAPTVEPPVIEPSLRVARF